MSGISYQERQDILYTHVLHIDDLIKENTELTLKLHLAEAEIGSLKVEIERLDDGQLALVVKLKDADNEVSRLSVIVKRQWVEKNWLRRHPQDKVYS